MQNPRWHHCQRFLMRHNFFDLRVKLLAKKYLARVTSSRNDLSSVSYPSYDVCVEYIAAAQTCTEKELKYRIIQRVIFRKLYFSLLTQWSSWGCNPLDLGSTPVIGADRKCIRCTIDTTLQFCQHCKRPFCPVL